MNLNELQFYVVMAVFLIWLIVLFILDIKN